MASGKGILDYYYLNSEASDVTVCTSTSNGAYLRIPSHKMVLCGLSPVLKRMFDRNEIEEGIVNIVVEGGEDVARSFIRFFYFGDVLNSNLLQALGLLKTSHKYQVDRLIIKSEEMILSSLTPDNACQIYEETRYQGSTSYIQNVLSLIFRSAFIIFQKESHLILSDNGMAIILGSDSLNAVDENKVADALWSWGQWNCLKNGGSVSHSDILFRVKDLSRHVRWRHVNDLDRFEQHEEQRRRYSSREMYCTSGRNPVISPSLLTFAEVVQLNDHSMLVDYHETKLDSQERNLVKFINNRDLFLIGLELKLKLKSSWTGAILDLLVLTLDQEMNNLVNTEKTILSKETELISYRFLFEYKKPTFLKRNTDHVLKIKRKTSYSYKVPEVRIPSCEYQNVLVRTSTNDNLECLHFLVQEKLYSVTKFYFVPWKV